MQRKEYRSHSQCLRYWKKKQESYSLVNTTLLLEIRTF
nr:MAG TPA: hypothetical protein [Caudoviricetes sp.]